MRSGRKNGRKSPNDSFFKVLFFVVGMFFILLINIGLKPIMDIYFDSLSPFVPVTIGFLGLTLFVWLGWKRL